MTLSSPYRQTPWTPRHIASKMVRAMEDYREQVGHRLRLLREDRNMSQEDAAHLVGVAVKTWHNWESGKRTPYESNWAKIAEKFGVDVRLVRGKPPAPLALGAAPSDEGEQLQRLQGQLDARLDGIVAAITALGLQVATLTERQVEVRASLERLARDRPPSKTAAAS